MGYPFPVAAHGPDTVMICFVTCPSEAVGAAIAKAVVMESLAACGNLVPGLVSFYRWSDDANDPNPPLVEDREVLLILKTTAGKLEALGQRIVGMHPYTVPQVVAWPLVYGHPPYMAWVQGQVG